MDSLSAMSINDFQALNHVYYQGHEAVIQSVRGDFYTISFIDNGKTKTEEVCKDSLQAIPIYTKKIVNQKKHFGEAYDIEIKQNNNGLLDVSCYTEVKDIDSFHALENFIRENTGPSDNGHIIKCENGIIK